MSMCEWIGFGGRYVFFFFSHLLCVPVDMEGCLCSLRFLGSANAGSYACVRHVTARDDSW